MNWNKVENELPKNKNEQVLLILKSTNEVCVGYYDSYFDRFYINGCSFNNNEIIYWMKLPNRPMLRDECRNCEINNKCKFAYENVNGSLDPCSVCKNKEYNNMCVTTTHCGNGNCQWEAK